MSSTKPSSNPNNSAASTASGKLAVAPFNERLTAPSQLELQTTLSPTSNKAAVRPRQQQQQQRQQQHSLHSSTGKAFQPIAAVRAGAKVAAAEAAVSAAAAALVPSKPAGRTQHASGSSGGGTHTIHPLKLQPQQQQQQLLDATTTAAAADHGVTLAQADACLQVQGQHTGPRRSSMSMPGTHRRSSAAELAVAVARRSMQGSLAGGGPAPAPAEAAVQQSEASSLSAQQLQASAMLQALSISCAGDSSSSSSPGHNHHQQQQQPSAAAQLAARGLNKRIRAQLRSAHGPPPYQRSLPPPRPASPPPVVLDADLLMSACCNPDAAASPADVVMADLSSCNISSIATSAPAGASKSGSAHSQDSVTSLQCFPALVSLDLSDKRLQCFAGLAVLPALQQLNLSANRIKCLSGLQEQQLVVKVEADSQHNTRLSSSLDAAGEGSSSSGGVAEALTPQENAHDGVVEGSSGQVALQQQPSAQSMQEQQQQSHMQLAEQQEEHQQGMVEEGGEGQGSGGLVLQAQQQLEQQHLNKTQLSLGFSFLCVLDVSYNMLSGEQLLGRDSPLGMLPMLAELHAGGNNIATLPAHLAPFTSLALLNLQHNQLQITAVAALGQLPALQLLDLSNNPLQGSLDTLEQCSVQLQDAEEAGGGHHVSCTSFPELQVLDLSSSRVRQVQPLQELLDRMPRLEVLQLVHTPLAERCKAGKVDVQDVQRPGLDVWLDTPTQTGSTSKGPRGQHSASERVPVLKIPEAASSSKVLAAASRAALACLPHEQLVAAFDRVDAGIDSWQQLAPVLEEEEEEGGSWIWGQGAGGDNDSDQQEQQQQQGPEERMHTQASDQEPVEDKTFLTGVSITGELPGEGEGISQQDAASPSAVDQSSSAAVWQDPTERLALALGLQVSQLAHITGRVPGNPEGALHRLRHALTHPLVDPDAGQRPQQHHMSATAATAAKQQPAKLVPLPQPIASTLSTRVQPVQDLGGLLKDMRGRLVALQGTLLPQLQAQATKMTGGNGARQ